MHLSNGSLHRLDLGSDGHGTLEHHGPLKEEEEEQKPENDKPITVTKEQRPKDQQQVQNRPPKSTKIVQTKSNETTGSNTNLAKASQKASASVQKPSEGRLKPPQALPNKSMKRSHEMDNINEMVTNMHRSPDIENLSIINGDTVKQQHSKISNDATPVAEPVIKPAVIKCGPVKAATNIAPSDVAVINGDRKIEVDAVTTNVPPPAAASDISPLKADVTNGESDIIPHTADIPNVAADDSAMAVDIHVQTTDAPTHTADVSAHKTAVLSQKNGVPDHKTDKTTVPAQQTAVTAQKTIDLEQNTDVKSVDNDMTVDVPSMKSDDNDMTVDVVAYIENGVLKIAEPDKNLDQGKLDSIENGTSKIESVSLAMKQETKQEQLLKTNKEQSKPESPSNASKSPSRVSASSQQKRAVKSDQSNKPQTLIRKDSYTKEPASKSTVANKPTAAVTGVPQTNTSTTVTPSVKHSVGHPKPKSTSVSKPHSQTGVSSRSGNNEKKPQS